MKQVKRDDGLNHFNIPDNQRILSYGAKVLVAGNDSTMYEFVQEYVQSALSLEDTKNTNLKKNM